MEARPVRRDPWLWVGLGCAIAFLVLGGLVNRRGDLAFDVPLSTAVRDLPVPESVWMALTWLGGGFLVVLGTVFVLFALATRRVRLALIVAGTLILATLFTDVVKDYVTRPRPPWDHLVRVTSYSFPSGHTLNSTVTYGLLAVVAWRSRIPVVARRAAVILGVALPFLIGLSRVALGVHYPTDVLAGWLAGVAFVALGAILIRLTGAMEPDPPRRRADAGDPTTAASP